MMATAERWPRRLGAQSTHFQCPVAVANMGGYCAHTPKRSLSVARVLVLLIERCIVAGQLLNGAFNLFHLLNQVLKLWAERWTADSDDSTPAHTMIP